MQANLHHPLHRMHDEAVTAGHWCSVHILHDYHFWLYLLIATAVVVFFIALLILAGGSAMHGGTFPPYYASPYGGF
ncbi:MAG: hypothetical protein WC334_01930 [Kiritimatiellales bacterium]